MAVESTSTFHRDHGSCTIISYAKLFFLPVEKPTATTQAFLYVALRKSTPDLSCEPGCTGCTILNMEIIILFSILMALSVVQYQKYITAIYLWACPVGAKSASLQVSQTDWGQFKMYFPDLWFSKFHHIVADVVEQSQWVGHESCLLGSPHLILHRKHTSSLQVRRSNRSEHRATLVSTEQH